MRLLLNAVAAVAERLLLNAPAMAVAGIAEERTAKGTGDVDDDDDRVIALLLPSLPCSLLSFDFTAAILALAVDPVMNIVIVGVVSSSWRRCHMVCYRRRYKRRYMKKLEG